jgi:hypothetical protein
MSVQSSVAMKLQSRLNVCLELTIFAAARNALPLFVVLVLSLQAALARVRPSTNGFGGGG